MTEQESPKHWFALYTKPKHEFKASKQINGFNIETFLPVITVKRKWSDRLKTITEPLIKGYIFIYADEKERLEAITSNGVVHTVSFNGYPAVIPEWQIESLKKMLNQPDEIIVSEKLPAGTLVEVVTLPLMGVKGVVEHNQNNEKYISVSIEIINRSVSVKLPADSVVKLVEH